jgi:hypothetical protein
MLKSRRMRWPGDIARMVDKRNSYRLSVENPEDKKPLRRPRSKWADNIMMAVRETELDGMEWTDLALNRDQWRAL